MITLLLALFAISAFLLWLKYNYSYWQRHNVPFIKPYPLVGNFLDVILCRNNFYMQIEKLHSASKKPLEGIYALHRPALIIRDLELIKRVMIKDFNCFSDRVVHADAKHDQLGESNLFFLHNPKWKQLRPKLSPVYSSGKIKKMYALMVDVS